MITPQLAEPGFKAALLALAAETSPCWVAITFYVFVCPVDTEVLGIVSEMGVSGPGLVL